VEIGETNAHCDRPTGPGFRAQPGGDPVGKMTQRRSENAFFGELLPERRLGSGRLRPPMRL
jgi:hypothetical protein